LLIIILRQKTATGSPAKKPTQKATPKLSAKAFYILTKAKALPLSIRKDEYRMQPTDEIGGITLVDIKTLETLRQIGKEFFKKALSRILSFNFNLTTISFPIGCMRPVSLLECFAAGVCTAPILLNKAWNVKDPIERVKYVISMQISTFRHTSNFLKPVFLQILALI